MKTIDQASQKILFTDARTHNGFSSELVSDELLIRIYDLMKWAPTAANGNPARFLFVKSPANREKLLACVAAGNMEKTKSAPVTVILAQDMAFYEKLPKLMPHVDAKSWYAGNQKLIEETAMRNSSFQGAYFMLAARALGIDCGPMSGFDAAKLDQAFFAGTTWKSNFLCNLGHGDASKLHPRNPRLDFNEACKIV